MDVMDMMMTADELRCQLVRIFKLDDHEENSRSEVLLDLYYHAVQFTRDNCFNKEQTACFLSVLRQVHDACVETPFDNMCECYKFLQGLVLCHSVQRPPFSIALFTLDQARHITQYVINTYFRHFKLYKYVFTPDVALDLTLQYPDAPLTPEPTEPSGGDNADNGEATQSPKPDEVSEEAVKKEEESEECSALRRLIRQQLSEELEKLRSCLDETWSEREKEVEEKVKSGESVSETGAAEKETAAADKKTKKKKDK